MSDPFRIDGPAILNVSGGRTSALMLRRVLDAHGGRLPADVHAVFCNTGKELPETYEFLARIEREWSVRLVWLEYLDRRAPAGRRFKVVVPDEAARNGEPFIRCVEERKHLPNQVMRFCTETLKLEPARDYMASLGYEEWTSAVGLRHDEPARVARVRARDHGRYTVRCPLFDGHVTKADVDAFWSAQPFTLSLKSWESNCDGCFMKGPSFLERIERDRPGTLAWWAEQEARRSARFRPERTYVQVIARAQRPTLLGKEEFDGEAPSLPCTCTD